MASSVYYSRNKTYGDKLQYNNGSKKNNYYGTRTYEKAAFVYEAKNSGWQNSQTCSYVPTFDYSYNDNNYVKKQTQYNGKDSSWKQKQFNSKKNTSPYSTQASEADLDFEVSGFKIVHSGKVLMDAQSSDSDSNSSPAEGTTTTNDVPCYASATKFLGPNPQAISLPSFL
mmetsp:Transcript_34833/g.40742  ORF Transcript_34833/g.40742 Transcript_34833/m.40742 type:complete len:170 (+) Transcript_34833:49-558(+)